MSMRIIILSMAAAAAMLVGCGTVGGNTREVRTASASSVPCAPDSGSAPQLDKSFH